MTHDIGYKRDVSLCMRFWKEMNKKTKNDEIKNVTELERIKDVLWDIAVYLKLSFI